MTNKEIKKKIISVLQSVEFVTEKGWCGQCISLRLDYSAIADALIAAGIGDVSNIIRLSADNALLDIVIHKAEVRSMEKRVKDAEHRAQVAERALHCLARSFAKTMCKYGDDTHYLVDGFIQDAYSQAEKELAEERKDENY